MLKYFVYIVVAYFIFRVAKNAIRLTIDGIRKPKELDEATELIKCSNCGGFTLHHNMMKFKEQNFCSEKCKEDYLLQNK